MFTDSMSSTFSQAHQSIFLVLTQQCQRLYLIHDAVIEISHHPKDLTHDAVVCHQQ